VKLDVDRGQWHLPAVTKGDVVKLASEPIVGFNGYNGSGKSIAAVLCAMAHLDAGRPALSTVRLHDYRHPRPCTDSGCTYSRHGQPDHLAAHPLWEPFTDWRQLPAFRGGCVVMDETTGVADAREKGAGMPVQIGNYLPQMRRKDVSLLWTTIDWRFTDARLRRITRVLLWAHGLWPKYYPGEIWPRNRAFLWRSYDARGIGDDFDPSLPASREGVQLLGRYLYVRGRGLAQHAYSTWEDPHALAQVDQAGMCMGCGGHRSRPSCRCERAPALIVPAEVDVDQAAQQDDARLAGVPAPAKRAGVRAERRPRRRRAPATSETDA